MTNIENKNKIDEAWIRLYSRLQNDGLVEESRSESIIKSDIFKWAASVAILCICSVIAFMLYKPTAQKKEMLTLHNSEIAANLVTTLEDGSIVYLANQATLSYPQNFDNDKREVYLQGEAFFDIHKNIEKPFYIETELIKIEVLGTAFNVKSRDNSNFSLSVLRGKVKVTLKETNSSINIEAGQTVLLNNKNLNRIETSDLAQFTDYANRMHFKDQRLADIVKVINSNSDNLKIELSPQLCDRLLTVTFIDENTSEMAELISIALNLQYKQSDNIIQISGLK
ncbi:FecR family protein [Dysgonomonas sp. OttesenSCG-928-M03]|nr:FecR family protein [Dysgonomonas sp. OttesenSCG-928-M03]